NQPNYANGMTPGISGSTQGLGIDNSVMIGTTFASNAARRINDASNVSPFIGEYRPEDNSMGIGDSMADALNLLGASPTQLEGNWYLEVTDTRNDRGSTFPMTSQTLKNWSIKFVSMQSFGTDLSTGGTGIPVGVDPSLAPTQGGSGSSYKPVTSPTVGLPGSISVVVDSTLAKTSQFAGQIYVAFTSPVFDTSG